MYLKKLISAAVFTAVLAATSAVADERSVALVLDASGSMNGRLADGTPKIKAAKSAVRDLAGRLPGDVRLSLRAYGHQSPRAKHDCKDTQLLVPFGSADGVRGNVIGTSDSLTAKGYTPITYVLGLAADDLKPESGEKVLVLVSDGKETCEGDPCLLAKKLAEADADLVIHTVGFGVDATTRKQLQCIASVARGEYFDANSSAELADRMAEAAQAEIEDEVLVIETPKEARGKLEFIEPYFNEVVDAETGEQVFKLTDSNPIATLPPGIYNIQVAKNLWLKSVEVKADETTTIRPGRLRIENPYFNAVLDPETGDQYEKATDSHPEFPLIAGRYDVSFGKALWRGVEIREGETTVLNPGRLRVEGAYFNEVLDPETGNELLKLTDSNPEMPLPPGTYDVQFGKALWRGINLSEGETTVLKPARFRMEKPYFNRIIDEQSGEVVEKMTDSHDDLPLPPGTYTIMFGNAAWKGFTVSAGQELTINPARIKVEAEKFAYNVFDQNGDKVIRLTEGTNDIPFPPGKYTLDVGGKKVPVTLKEGKRLILKTR